VKGNSNDFFRCSPPEHLPRQRGLISGSELYTMGITDPLIGRTYECVSRSGKSIHILVEKRIDSLGNDHDHMHRAMPGCPDYICNVYEV